MATENRKNKVEIEVKVKVKIEIKISGENEAEQGVVGLLTDQCSGPGGSNVNNLRGSRGDKEPAQTSNQSFEMVRLNSSTPFS